MDPIHLSLIPPTKGSSRVSIEEVKIQSDTDVVIARQVVRRIATEIGLSLVNQTKVITAASEIARNTFIYGGGGRLIAELLPDVVSPGMRLIFEDEGPGIPDVQLALSDGFTSGKGLGMGLGGARRLVDRFEIETEVGKGTRITLEKWK